MTVLLSPGSHVFDLYTDDLDPEFREWPEPCRPTCKPGDCFCADNGFDIGYLMTYSECPDCEAGDPCRFGCPVQLELPAVRS